MNPRLAAAGVIAAVLHGKGSLATLLGPVLDRFTEPRERALTQEFCYGALRHQPQLDFFVERLLQHPLKPREREVRALLLIGIYQLLYMRVPDHAAVAETVRAAKLLRKPWAAGLVNGVLRGFLREREVLLAAAAKDEAAATAFPVWLLAEISGAWPEAWPAIVLASNARPPMTLRVDLTRGDRDGYLAELTAAGVAARPGPAPAAVTLDQPVDVAALPGFAAGRVSVQDAAAQLAAPLLAPHDGERLLDACAAPGGKSGHVLELAPAAQLTAIDDDPARLARVAENLARLGRSAALVAADAAEPARWWDGRPFDRILLDAPCSATGVIRRHPDIKLLRTPADLAALRAAQARLLDALWPLLAKGGILLYATCSILPGENEDQIAAFLERHPDARERPIEAAWGRPRRHGRQILPGEEGMDGFYYALLEAA